MNIKLTVLRKSILDMISGSDRILSVKKIWEQLDKRPNITSVYRATDFLESNDLISSISISGIKFYLSRNRSGHGHFIICRQCNEIMNFSECTIRSLQKKISERYNYIITSHILYFEGYCRECRAYLEKKSANGVN